VIAGTYPLVVELNVGSRTRLDYIHFKQEGATSVEGARTSSWGRIKGLYR